MWTALGKSPRRWCTRCYRTNAVVWKCRRSKEYSSYAVPQAFHVKSVYWRLWVHFNWSVKGNYVPFLKQNNEDISCYKWRRLTSCSGSSVIIWSTWSQAEKTRGILWQTGGVLWLFPLFHPFPSPLSFSPRLSLFSAFPSHKEIHRSSRFVDSLVITHILNLHFFFHISH